MYTQNPDRWSISCNLRKTMTKNFCGKICIFFLYNFVQGGLEVEQKKKGSEECYFYSIFPATSFRFSGFYILPPRSKVLGLSFILTAIFKIIYNAIMSSICPVQKMRREGSMPLDNL